VSPLTLKGLKDPSSLLAGTQHTDHHKNPLVAPWALNKTVIQPFLKLLQPTMKTNTIIVLGCLLFVLALAAIGAEAARGDYEDRRGSGGSGADYGGGGSGGGRGGYDDEEDQDFGRGGSNYPAPIEPEVTKVVKST